VDYADRVNTDLQYWHPGFAWAASATTLTMLAEFNCGAPLIERTLGGGDRHMCMGIIGRGAGTIPEALSDDYRAHIMRWCDAAQRLSLGLAFVPGVIRQIPSCWLWRLFVLLSLLLFLLLLLLVLLLLLFFCFVFAMAIIVLTMIVICSIVIVFHQALLARQLRGQEVRPAMGRAVAAQFQTNHTHGLSLSGWLGNLGLGCAD
jgi:hypothetical protein